MPTERVPLPGCACSHSVRAWRSQSHSLVRLARIKAPLGAVPYVVATALLESEHGGEAEHVCILSAGLVHIITLSGEGSSASLGEVWVAVQWPMSFVQIFELSLVLADCHCRCRLH